MALRSPGSPGWMAGRPEFASWLCHLWLCDLSKSLALSGLIYFIYKMKYIYQVISRALS